jgi:hypothetical protein
MWQPLPREMAAWWRDRAVSSLRAQDGHLTVCGPAATRARIQLTRPNGTGDLTQFPDLDVGAS